MRLLVLAFFLLMSFQSHAARLTCNAEKLSFSFGGSNTIDFLQTAMKYQDFDFTSVKNVGDMQKVVKHKKALKSMYDMYKDSPFIWGETYQKMLPLCDENQKKTLFAKAFTYYENRWRMNSHYDPVEREEFSEYLFEFEMAGHTKSKFFHIRSYEHFMSIFEAAIQNIENNTDTMRAALKSKRENEKQEIQEMENEAKEMDRLIAEQKAANEKKRKMQEEIAAKQRELDRLKNQSFETSQSTNKQRGHSTSSNVGNRTIKPNSVICRSESAYDRQMQALAQNDHRLFSGCTVNERAVKGWFDDISMFSGTCTLLSSDRSRKMWVNCESVQD
ncbi:hypothetical protein [uncultured Alteromonas sp.]|uniref:hypothetical protein n=1 Tax=uncultured Alteromonas sp. TaxID=179113 RepID=UPI0030DA2293